MVWQKYKAIIFRFCFALFLGLKKITFLFVVFFKRKHFVTSLCPLLAKMISDKETMKETH